MFLCSKEQPVTNNESLYQRQSSNGELILDQSKGLPVNRYGFVYKNDNIDSEIAKLLKVLINQLDTKVFIILCWLVEIPEKSKVASKVIEKRYEKKKWEILKRNSHYIAIKEILHEDINEWPPLGINPLDGGMVIMLGNNNSNHILSLLSNEDAIFLAKNKYFAPDADFLSRLNKNKTTALYQVNDEMNNTGLVLVGDVIVEMEDLGKTIPISQIYDGELAYKIFV